MSNNEITPPGCIAACTVDEIVPNDDMIQNALTYFHGSTSQEKTLEFFDRQVSELAGAVRVRLENDLKLFQTEHMIDEAEAQASTEEKKGYVVDDKEL